MVLPSLRKLGAGVRLAKQETEDGCTTLLTRAPSGEQSVDARESMWHRLTLAEGEWPAVH